MTDNYKKEIKDMRQKFNNQIIDLKKEISKLEEKIMFLKDGYKEWEGTNKEIFKTDNESVTDFVYSSDLFKKVRENLNSIKL